VKKKRKTKPPKVKTLPEWGVWALVFVSLAFFYLCGLVDGWNHPRHRAETPAATQPAAEKPIPRWPEGHNFHAEPDPHPFDPQYDRDQHWTA
jgi:hypothetical protein